MMQEHQTMYFQIEHWMPGLMKAYFTQTDVEIVCVDACVKAGSIIHLLKQLI